MLINNVFNIGDIVYSIHDPEQLKRIITEIEVFPEGLLMYSVSSDGSEPDTKRYYSFELSSEPDLSLKLS